MVNKSVDREKCESFYIKMLKVRMLEEKADELFRKGLVPGSLHTSIGQEALSAGVTEALNEKDIVVGSHRAHGLCLLRGMETKKFFAELLGKKAGICKGKAGSMHIMEFAKGMMGANGIVGQQLPIATGIGFALKLKKTNNVCVCFFGDGASNAGVFHESLNIASLWKLPVIFVCENNGYAVSVPVWCSTSIKDIGQRAISYGIPGDTIDGMDVIEVYRATRKAVERARNGEGPTLIECKTYRFLGHSRGDPPYGPYRTKEELDSWKERDPIKRMLSDIKLSEDKIEEIKRDIASEYEEAVQFAMESPYPDKSEALENIYI